MLTHYSPAMKDGSVITVLIVNSQPTLRRGLRMLLASEADMQVAGEAAGLEPSLALCSALCPDVALVDVETPEAGGLSVATALRAACPGTRVILLALHEDAALRQRAKHAGIAALVPMQTPGEMLAAIRHAAGKL